MAPGVTCWDKVGAVGQAVEAFLVLLGLVVAIWQLWQIRRQQTLAIEEQRLAIKQQRLAIVWQMFRELGSKKARKARRFIFQNRSVYQHLLDGTVSLESLHPEAVEAAQNVSNVLDRLGYAVVKRLADEDVVLDGYHYLVMRCWIVLEPFIKVVRRERGERTYQKGFEELASRAFRNPDYPSREEVEFGCV